MSKCTRWKTSSSVLCLKFAEQYGDIFSINTFGVKLVVLHSYKRVREALVEKGEHFTDRPVIPLFEVVLGNRGRALIVCCGVIFASSLFLTFSLILICAAAIKGLVVSNGNQWKQQRRFALHTLRNFGIGKKSLEPSIQIEANYLIDAFSSNKGKSHVLPSGLWMCHQKSLQNEAGQILHCCTSDNILMFLYMKIATVKIRLQFNTWNGLRCIVIPTWNASYNKAGPSPWQVNPLMPNS